MGTHDVTCAISHLPIRYGEACRFLFLRQRIAHDDEMTIGTWEHVWAKWVPMGLPVQGVYDGYGRLVASIDERGRHVEFGPDALHEFQVEAVARVCEPLPPEEAAHFTALGRFPRTIGSLMAACERGWLKVRLPCAPSGSEGGPTATLRVSPCYVREGIWRSMVAAREDGGIGRWRPKLRRLLDVVGFLRNVVDSHADLEKGPDVLAEAYPMALPELTPMFEEAPDVLVVGGDWRPDVSTRATLRKFTDEDWKRLATLVLDLHVWTRTARHDLRREIHPELYTDQFHFTETALLAQLLLQTRVQEECRRIEQEDED